MKKRVNGTWQTKSPLKYDTATDALTSFPATVITDGTNASADVFGNMEQSGTPTPTTPIQPSECGERTGNLFDYVSYFSSSFVVYSEYFNYADIQLIPNTTYSFSTNFNEGSTPASMIKETPFIVMNGTDAPSTATGGLGNNTIRILTTDNSGIVRIYKRIKSNSAANIPTLQDFQNGKWVMCNVGSTAISYEPYGYKIPISSANTTTNVYLGEVQSTRKIKKLVLTGEETYTYESSYSRIIATLPNAKIEGLRLTQVYCTHFISVYDGRPLSEVPNNSIYSSDVSADRFFIKETDYSTAADFKSYLQQQYAAGTPVTVWYVLAESTTGIVNEPLRKIGDYSDSVSVTNIPTITGSQTFDVDTTLKPSEADLTYHGWHRREPKNIQTNYD